MWVVRDKLGLLRMYQEPICKDEDENSYYVTFSDKYLILDDDMFPNFKHLKFGDEPVEVHLFTNEQICNIIDGASSLAQESHWITRNEIIERFKNYIRLDLSFLIK